MNETFWEAQNLDLEACANFLQKSDPEKFSRAPKKNHGTEKKISDWMLWEDARLEGRFPIFIGLSYPDPKK